MALINLIEGSEPITIEKTWGSKLKITGSTTDFPTISG